MRAGLAGCHTIASVAVEGDVDLQWLCYQAALVKRIEDMMCVEGSVIVSDTGVVAPDDQVRTAKILAKQCV